MTIRRRLTNRISTHSRAKAAGCYTPRRGVNRRYFNSQPREGGWILLIVVIAILKAFQLTAARRRLADPQAPVPVLA